MTAVPVLVRVEQITASATFLLPFRCVHCGFETLARVESKGLAQVGGNGLAEEESRDRARTSATDACQKNAEQLAPLGVCPKCRGRDEGALAAVKRRAWIGPGILLVLGGVMGAVSLFRMPDGVGVVVALVELALAGYGAHWVLRFSSWKWNEAGERVDVLNERELAQELETLAALSAAAPDAPSESQGASSPDIAR
jgi:hypothetical protein